jgi:aminoglycoside 2'-N-acetyltransferase I
MQLRVGHTHEFEPDLLDRVHDLLGEVFGGNFSDEDWDHSIGGIHVIVFDGDELIGHASVVQRHLIVAGRVVRTGYVEGVGVRADHQRRGLGGEMMAIIEGVIERAYDIGALCASSAAAAMYSGRGWIRWRGPSSALTPGGVVATPDEDGSIFVWPTVGQVIDASADLTCDWRAGDVW